MSSRWTSKLTALATDESGQDLVEYALVAAIVALGAIASVKSLRTSISNLIAPVATALNSAV